MHIVVKEIDQLLSKLHKNKKLSEYLVYVMAGEVPVECHIEYGSRAKDSRVTELFAKHSLVGAKWLGNQMDLSSAVKELNHQQFKSQN